MDTNPEFFNLEKEMTPIVNAWFISNGFSVKNEVVTPEGVCDLVCVKFHEKSVKDRLDIGLRSHMSNDLQVRLWALASSYPEISFERIFELFKSNGVDKDILQNEIKKLIDKRFLTLTDNNLISGSKSWFPVVTNLISVELKLHNFNEALSQARRYSEFSNQTFIGMPSKFVDKLNPEKINQLILANIGLLSVSPYGVNIFLGCKKKKLSRQNQFVQNVKISELFWKDKLKNIQH